MCLIIAPHRRLPLTWPLLPRSGLAGADLRPMSLGLSHSLSRYKLKFSPDKVR